MAKCNHINKARVGQVIRAFDFPGTTDHYIQGTVISKGLCKDPVRNIALFEGYTIKIEQERPADDGDRVGHQGYVPFKQIIGDYDNRVELMTDEMMENIVDQLYLERDRVWEEMKNTDVDLHKELPPIFAYKDRLSNLIKTLDK